MAQTRSAHDTGGAYQPYRADTVAVTHDGPVTVVTITRPERRNAVDSLCADQLRRAFEAFDRDEEQSVGVLTGTEGTFCAGADLKALAEGDRRPIPDAGPAPMGPTRLTLSKPVIAAVEGFAVAGGIELALWCDLRVAAENAIFGAFERRFGVPLCTALEAAVALAHQLAALPQFCLRSDRMSALEQWGLSEAEAAVNEARRGRRVISSGEALEGARQFTGGAGRGGDSLA